MHLFGALVPSQDLNLTSTCLQHFCITITCGGTGFRPPTNTTCRVGVIFHFTSVGPIGIAANTRLQKRSKSGR